MVKTRETEILGHPGFKTISAVMTCTTFVTERMRHTTYKIMLRATLSARFGGQLNNGTEI